jgi:thiamine pyrophosphate-dependent acetolactate synthase large subunit-like protein
VAEISGSELVARSLKNEGAEAFFYIMGGPMGEVEALSIKSGIRGIDVRHEQAAAMMAHAYSRLLQKPGVCMGCSGPGAINLTTGLANALVDCAPVVALGGAAQIGQAGRGVFQEFDQLALMKQCTKWAERVLDPRRIPEHISTAFQKAMSGKPGPVYLDLPRDILYAKVKEEDVRWGLSGRPILRSRPTANPADIEALACAMLAAKRPIIVSGSGVIWSRAWDEMRAVVETTGIPFWTTPQGRGVVPDDHPLSFQAVRTTGFREADFVLVLGTRMNYVIGHAAPPRVAADAVIARIDIDSDEIATTPRKVDIAILGDCKAVLQQLRDTLKDRASPHLYQEWVEKLAAGDAAKRSGKSPSEEYNSEPIHPLRLCYEIKEFMNRDAIMVVDGREILNYGRQSISTFAPAHRLNSGPFGIMGVGLPFGVGAKVAKPDKQVIVLHGDGSFGLNGMELDTAVRHRIPILVVISLNGGWTADPAGKKAGRDLGYTRYDRMAEALGCYGEYVEKPEDIRGALERAQKQVDAGAVAVVNVKTDFRAGSSTPSSIDYDT